MYYHPQGQCFVAVDPKVFAPGFEDRLSELIHQCKDSEPVRIFLINM